MNRKRKINQILNKKIKKMNAKKHHNNKTPYVSKADRAAAELATTNEQELQQPESNVVEQSV